MASAFKSRDFTNEISVSDALYLELFDDVPYKWLIDKLSPRIKELNAMTPHLK